MSSPENENLSVRIVTADYYLQKPIPELGDQCYSAFRSLPIYRVPVIRIFGPTADGVKTCLHIHGVFPYIFVPNWNHQVREKELYNFAVNLDKAINTSFAHSNSKSSHVHKITQVSGIPFYGYHESEKDFLKIEFYNPAMVKRASELLLNGAVLNTIFQPHESHIPYILQFFIDNNLYGMNNIAFSSYKLRNNVAQDVINLNDTIIRSSSNVNQQSYSTLEIDITVSNICNASSNQGNVPNNPGLAFIWEDEKKRRRFNQKSSQITPNESQQRPEKPVTRTECYFREKLMRKLKAIKDNETCMDLDHDETPSLNATFEELNTQSKSLLEILQNLANEQEKSKDAGCSRSSSPSLVFSDDENNVAEVSLLSSQPLLKFNAEDDSILGNNFSEDENDIDDHDHQTLSQTMTYSTHQNMSSSDDSGSEIGGIPQLDGACDVKITKKSAAKKIKPSRSKKISSGVENQDNSINKRRYNLRSKDKVPEKSSCKNENFQPKDFKIILQKLDHAKISPKKTYPRLQIDAQKSPRSNHSRSSQDSFDGSCKEPILLVPQLDEDSFKETASSVPETRNDTLEPSLPMSPSIKSADTSSLQRSDKKVYPPLDITIKKSPKSAQKLPSVEEVKPSRPVASVHCLKKRKINFGDDESEVARTKETIPNSDLIGPKWKKSLKRRKKDDTSFKIGDSFSLLQFRKFKKNPSMEKISEKLITSDSFANTCDKSRQNYSLRISNSVPFTSCSASTHDKSAERNDSVEMESLHISDDDEGANGGNKEQYCAENNDQLAKLEVLAAPLPMSDEELTEAAPPSIVQKDEAKLQKDSLIEPSSDSQIHKVPVLKIPRIDPDMLSDSGSLIFYENSSIELNISEPNEECTKMNRDPSLETSKIKEKIESCSKHIPTDVEELHQVTEKNSKATTSSHNNSNSTKVPSKKAAVKKKSLGMRIRKKTNQVTPSHSKLDRKSSAALEKIECEADKKSTVQLPIMLVDQERDQNTSLATPLDSYPDSNIVLNITKCSQDRPSKSPNNETNNLKTKSTPNLATSRQHISNSANSADASCQIDVPKNSTKLSSPLTFEDSQLELDIFKFCSSEESTKENQRTPEYVENRNLATPPVYENQTYADSLNRRNEENRNLSKSPSIFNDVILSKRNAPLSDAAIGRRERVGSPEVVFEENSTANENLPASQSIFCDQLPIASNTNLLDILFDNSDHFFNRKNVVKPNLTRNENPTSSRSVLGKNISDISSTSLPKQLVDDQDTYFNQENAPELKNNANSNLAKSPTLFSDECSGESIAKSLDPSTKLDKNNRTTTTIENNDLNTSCSNDSLFNVLESLTPKTKEALNRKLDSFVGDENVATSQTSKHSLTTSAAPICDLEKAITEIELFENVSDASVAIVDLPTESSSRANCKNYVSVDLCTPDILDKAAYTISNSGVSTKSTPGPVREQVLFEEDSFDLELSATCDQEQPVNRTPALDKLLLNNSIWDSMDDDDDLSSQEDNEIMSFYNDQTINPAHITVIRDIADEDTDDSSPIAKALTPESQTSNEILSFYGSQSPESMICSISQDVIKPAAAKSTPSTRSTAAASSPLLPHITPAGSSTKKTSSPLYTPTLKRLMLKKVNDNDKRRVSSQRFRSEPFLSEITEQEEDEEGKKKKEFDKNTSFSLPLELECDVSKIDGKSALNTSKTSTCSGASYQIDGATLDNTCGFKMNLENLQDIKTDKQFQFITLISLEIFAQTRADLKPDPEYDPVTCLFYSIHHDAPNFPNLVSGIIVVSENALPADLNRFKSQKMVVSSEAELFDAFLTLIRKWDPDMFIGYEVEMLSWGFLIQRGHFLGRNLIQELSRVRETKQNEPTEKPTYEDDEYSNELKLPGRIVLNVWRLMRHEVNLQSYTFENILFHVLHQRVPYHSFKFLTECWKNDFKKWIVVDYFLFRAESYIILLEQLDFICRTSELARLFGIQFYEVLSRGSQFRVESMMLRLAKTQNYVAVSPSVRQRAHMRAPESLPLIMEPESKFYTDPIIVLDFQSLYPSIIIAYNYCFSTCLGRIDSLGQNEPFHFGCVEHTVPGDLLVKLENSLNLSAAGVAYVDKTVRKGILPSMLEEILETRLMVKRSMKENKDNSTLKRVLHARQLGLKLIANVTYGYTSANFSGRMPCMEIADSVVSKGRETLERAIELVNGTKEWGARVVYGDTDSLFVLVPNRTKEEAFRIGSEIAEAVTNQNPKPVKLKLEKVYTASILQTKKRYVGYMYESPDQEKPVYDAKGIETVRRDGCPAVSKILEKSLKLLFETKNINTVKQYVQRQFTKLISGRISIQELTFAREYRGMNNYKPAACVPALQLAKQALLKDRRAEPRVKERVRYVIVTGAPGVPLIRLVRTPKDFLDTPGSLINTEYYITRAIIPALERCFNLMNVNVQAWYTEIPKKQKLNLPIDYEFRNKAFKKTNISHYFSSSKCLSCSKVAGGSVCQKCGHKPQRLALILGNMINQWQRKHNNVAKICRSCCGRNEPIGCSSLDCPIYYLFRQTEEDAQQVRYAENLKREYLYF